MIVQEQQSEFTYHSARAGAVTAGLALAVAVETLVVHLLFAARYPAWAWGSTALGVASLVYLAAEYRAVGRGAVRVRADAVVLRLAGRVAADLPRGALAGAHPFTWRDAPDRADPRYLNAMAPAEPNVLLSFTHPVLVRIAWGLVRRRVERVALRLDDPAAFVRTLHPPQAL
ncbi:MAG TPA: hypothetical protein VE869_07255 [Gemmatimonas sp.]|nr:hypothetical protein [Gemmatimonas sp.]